DGKWIYFDRQYGDGSNYHVVGRVPVDGGVYDTLFFKPAAGQDAATPGVSPDTAIVLFGGGTHDTGGNLPRDVVTRTMDVLSTLKRAVAYYTDTTYAVRGPDPILSPRLSPDGTRLAVRS